MRTAGGRRVFTRDDYVLRVLESLFGTGSASYHASRLKGHMQRQIAVFNGGIIRRSGREIIELANWGIASSRYSYVILRASQVHTVGLGQAR